MEAQTLQSLTAGNKNVKRTSKLGRCLISLSVQNCSRSPRRVTRHAFADYPHIHTQFPSCHSHGLFCVTDALGFLWLRGEWKRVEFVKDGISCVVSCQCHSDLWPRWMNVRSNIKSVLTSLIGVVVFSHLHCIKGKGKAIPLLAWTGPEGSRKLRLPDFKTFGTWRW